MVIRGLFGNSYKGAQLALEVSLVLGTAAVALVQGLAPVALEQDSADGPVDSSGWGPVSRKKKA